MLRCRAGWVGVCDATSAGRACSRAQRASQGAAGYVVRSVSRVSRAPSSRTRRASGPGVSSARRPCDTVLAASCVRRSRRYHVDCLLRLPPSAYRSLVISGNWIGTRGVVCSVRYVPASNCQTARCRRTGGLASLGSHPRPARRCVSNLAPATRNLHYSRGTATVPLRSL